jgi:hypothetical protein
VTGVSCRYVLPDADRARLRYKAARADARTNISIPLPYCTSRTSYKAFGKTQPFLSRPRGWGHHGRLPSLFSGWFRPPARPFRRWITRAHCIGTCRCTCIGRSPGPGCGPGPRSACPARPAHSENNTLYHAEIGQQRRVRMPHAKNAGRTSPPSQVIRKQIHKYDLCHPDERRIQITERINGGYRPDSRADSRAVVFLTMSNVREGEFCGQDRISAR